MEREIKIQTGISFFIHRTFERIKLLIQAVKLIFTRRKWDEIAFDEKEDDSIEDEATLEIDVNFNPLTSVLFSSDYRKQWPKLNKHSLMIYRSKIREECLWLADKGYKDFIINYGCNYGIIALSELLHTKNKLNLSINLYYGKAMHDHASCITKLDSIKLMQICHDHGIKHIEVLPPCDFVKKVICKVSRISSELGIIETDQKIPESIYEHYKRVERKMR